MEICPKCGGKLNPKGFTGAAIKRYRCTRCGHRPSASKVIIREAIKFQWTDWANCAEKLQDLRNNQAGYSSTDANQTIPKDSLVWFLSDFHIGAGGFDFQSFIDITNLIKKEGIHFILIGDELDSFFTSFKSAVAVHNQIFTPEEQHLFFESWLNDVGDYLLASTQGNHDDFMNKLIGFSNTNRLKGKFAPYFDGIGKLNLKCGDIEYNIGLSHRGKGYSMYNPLHGGQRLRREDIEDADVIAIAHHHDPAILQHFEAGRWRYFFRGGSLKVQDSHSRLFKHGNTLPIYPSGYFYGEYRQVVPFMHIEDALKFRDINIKQE